MVEIAIKIHFNFPDDSNPRTFQGMNFGTISTTRLFRLINPIYQIIYNLRASTV